MSIILLISGRLGDKVLQDLISSSYILKGVLTDKKSENIISRCQHNSIPIFIGNPRGGKSKKFINSKDCDVLLSVNYLFIVEEDLINLPQKYAVNLHGSLLPKFRGRTPHVWAIINGEKETGVTAHLMSREVDEGQIIKQVAIPIEENDCGIDILDKFELIYPELVNEVLSEIENRKVKLYLQDNTKATYFGKRTAADGQIDWNWNKERIRNWIRAQAKPYPGAFTFYRKEKVVIHQADLSDFGFHQNQNNGTIVQVTEERVIVKTPNGCLSLSEIEKAQYLKFEKGEILV